MSLSFPLLIAAVPLYALDYTGANQAYVKAVREWRQQHPDASLAEHAAAVTERPVFDVNWFSDGGLTANLPVQFFDSVLPSRPTFAIDLAPFSDDHPRSDDERDNSHLPLVNQGGGHRRTARWAPKPLSALFSFGLSLVETARTWVDQASLTMPGYRDRVVTVYQDGAEGGINLAMPPELVTALSQRGRFAAARLVDRFGPGGVGWPNHKWIRYPHLHRRPERLAGRLRTRLHRAAAAVLRRPAGRPGRAALVPGLRGEAGRHARAYGGSAHRDRRLGSRAGRRLHRQPAPAAPDPAAGAAHRRGVVRCRPPRPAG